MNYETHPAPPEPAPQPVRVALPQAGFFLAFNQFFPVKDKLAWGYVMPGRREFLAYCKKLVDTQALPEDWYTIDATKFADRTGKADLGALLIDLWTFFTGKTIWKHPDIEAFVTAAKSKNRDFGEPAMDYLARMYGTELNSLLELARSHKPLAAPLNTDGEMAAQALYAIRHEMARTLTDIFIRRTGLGTLGYVGDEITKSIASVASRELGWGARRAEKELEAVKKAMVLPE